MPHLIEELGKLTFDHHELTREGQRVELYSPRQQSSVRSPSDLVKVTADAPDRQPQGRIDAWHWLAAARLRQAKRLTQEGRSGNASRLSLGA
ncbi:hypothetical protein [Amylibacter sp. IMCC11727]|uniref:hypothetical protein n=1 Tax=Amylibacter sp. IMCC11727 TaxID=3039851 RepID=UPI003265E602